MNHISSDMKKSLVKTLILNNSKICLLVDESTRIGNKETLIIFIKASIDGTSLPILFPLELIDVEKTRVMVTREKFFKKTLIGIAVTGQT